MTTTDQQILDAARAALLEIVTGRVESFGDGSETAKTLRIQELRDTINEYQAKVNRASKPRVRRLVHGRVGE